MTNRSFMKYGSREVPLALPEEVVPLAHTEPRVRTSPGTFKAMLASHLELQIGETTSVGIVVADKTRLCQYSLYLPVVMRSYATP